MPTKKSYSQAARVQGIRRTLGARHGITVGELAEEFGGTNRTLYLVIVGFRSRSWQPILETSASAHQPSKFLNFC